MLGVSALIAVTLGLRDAAADQEKVLNSFCSKGGVCTDGAGPVPRFNHGQGRDFYGTTEGVGGARDVGVVFELEPSPSMSSDQSGPQ